ncbi:thiol:disulfide interchange protein [Brenneria roseae subsp. americana]|uniref:Thiol:disulfide interchange protein n=1 Tax=Brenneria roseae subsp. americana TaxID=1508507 RepID=A0A2U1TMJ9_9GAMM|nr:DsbC family protein [Brenneria roseae]PWC10599.1 thiol:disulfide interchange protein [Brenneria roseae subsp. americana]
MKSNHIITKLFLFTLLCGQAFASDEDKVKELVTTRMGNSTTIDSVRKTDYLGLYEIKIGKNIIYTDINVNYYIAGHVINAKTLFNYTNERLLEASKTEINTLPLDLAVKITKGDGSRKLFIFEDPNCGYCKLLRKKIQNINNVTIYTFMYNILNDSSWTLSRNILCAKHPDIAFEDWMVNEKQPETAPIDCKDPNKIVYELGKKMNITGTPTLFFIDGTSQQGVMEIDALEKKWLSIK